MASNSTPVDARSTSSQNLSESGSEFPLKTITFPYDHPYSDNRIIVSHLLRGLFLCISLLIIIAWIIMILLMPTYVTEYYLNYVFPAVYAGLILASLIIVLPPRLRITENFIEFIDYRTQVVNLSDIDPDQTYFVTYKRLFPYSKNDKNGWWFVESYITLAKYSRSFILEFQRYSVAVIVKFKENKRRPLILAVSGDDMDLLAETIRNNARMNSSK